MNNGTIQDAATSDVKNKRPDCMEGCRFLACFAAEANGDCLDRSPLKKCLFGTGKACWTSAAGQRRSRVPFHPISELQKDGGSALLSLYGKRKQGE
ncbi:hypothetical protein HF394_02830 [Planococcus glaciei]|uniref:Uncharacterized protein n=1 Tax=Planococcus glaciei TaxID=459472 RepID=A0A7H8Q6P8_9BACL|nr:hypothetical protein [Planococcus glaciei]QKX49597.1 hypothetical protein HF394_02830 [Planococcus glaciei]